MKGGPFMCQGRHNRKWIEEQLCQWFTRRLSEPGTLVGLES